MDQEIPPFLTVVEAGRLLRISRTKTYELATEWRATNGRSGLPVIDLGDLLRVPGPAIRQMLCVGLTGAVSMDSATNGEPPSAARPASASGGRSPAPPAPEPPAEQRAPATGEAAGSAVPARKPRTRSKTPHPTDQLPLFPALPFAPPDSRPPSPS